ncbi:MAG TPA: GNAT family N-acetyltransferase [Drouetiella sp.]
MSKNKSTTSTDNLVIKLMSEKDVDQFSALRLKALKEEPTSFGGDYEEAKLLEPSEFAKRLVSDDFQFALGAFNPDLVGFAGFYRERGKKACHKGVVWGVYVMPDFRGLGIAKQLMMAAIMCAQEMPGLDYMKLTVATQNKAAFDLYKSLGFKQFGVEFAALMVDGKPVDEAMMQLNLRNSGDE